MDYTDITDFPFIHLIICGIARARAADLTNWTIEKIRVISDICERLLLNVAKIIFF